MVASDSWLSPLSLCSVNDYVNWYVKLLVSPPPPSSLISALTPGMTCWLIITIALCVSISDMGGP